MVFKESNEIEIYQDDPYFLYLFTNVLVYFLGNEL